MNNLIKLNNYLLINAISQQVPNGTGWFLGAMQLVIYAIYRNSNSSKQIVEDLEEGDQTERLLPPSSIPTQE